MMREKIKSVLLAVLVALSLFQSFMLAYNKPDPNPINDQDYVKSEMMGETLTMEDLLTPKDIVLHFGNSQHTVLYPGEYFFTLIMDNLESVELSEIQRMNPTKASLLNMRQEHPGMEVRFHVPVTPGMIRNTATIHHGLFELPQNLRFDTIWLMKDKDETVRAFLVSDEEVYMAANVTMSARDLERNVTFGQFRVKYTTDDGILYIPAEDISVAHRARFPYTTYTSEQLRNNLFVDPGISRSIIQRDNTEIITDGKRGLEIDHTSHWMNYSDPAAPADEEMDVESNLNSALQFVNENGGWNGDYLLYRLPEGFNQEYRFILYFEAAPILPTNPSRFGYIQVTMSNGLATGYERSIINPDWDKVERTTASLPGGEVLSQKLQSYGDRSLIRDLFPAYEAVIREDIIELVPKWAVERTDGYFDFLDKG